MRIIPLNLSLLDIFFIQSSSSFMLSGNFPPWIVVHMKLQFYSNSPMCSSIV